MDIKERLYNYISHKKMRNSEFERLAGLSNGYLNNLKHTPGIDKIENILRAFPDLNREWLLTGRGNMINSQKNISYDFPAASNMANEPYGTYIAGERENIKGVVKEAIDALSYSNKILARQLEFSNNQNDRLMKLLEELSLSTKGGR